MFGNYKFVITSRDLIIVSETTNERPDVNKTLGYQYNWRNLVLCSWTTNTPPPLFMIFFNKGVFYSSLYDHSKSG